ncbi:peptidase S1 and S6 chymotrypsin/Hap [Coriobacterium glomerans PW2]|uniref:Peptidase S1 and S6 chymotrypsin/Hap n=1 Tax=Coriobacterium glomerans (strain ATCC 49209 / DSM 20642 / JCM 10262 / PW2) TaxID=700015 RepID=F2N8V3_CORGP|nr:trypsin-like peptidase domain-containing protein [Coriobacterium glomerans]AEB07553.1 peptidase S1 and S6 chymotrypsin/Hap [Coriobacterium glomerans PW2]
MKEDKTPKPPEGFMEGPDASPSRAGHEEDPTSLMPGTDGHVADAWDSTSNQPPFAPQTETVRQTVVKTKAKKFPVFLSGLIGIAVGALLLFALAMSGALQLDGSDVGSSGSSSSSGSSGSQTIKINPEDNSLAEAVAAKALPSVVSVSVQQNMSKAGMGSGVVIDKDGDIVTNYHVIENASAIVVQLSGESYEAEIIGTDKSSDLAVIKMKKVDSSKLTPIDIGDSTSLAVGQWVMAIGSPFGNEQSVSTGIVSSLYRSTALPSASGTSIYANMIQTDAAINPGNSGGALVNSKGELIGINSIIESTSGSSSGVGFAIPSKYAIDIAKQIIAGKTPAHPYIGLTVSSVNALSARQFNLSASEGALVNSVSEGSPAAEAGIKENDIITRMNDKPVTSADNLIISLREHSVGDTVTLTLKRGGDEKKVDVKLGSDESVSNQQESSKEDATKGNGSGNSMSQDQFLQYLQNLLGNNGGQNGAKRN